MGKPKQAKIVTANPDYSWGEFGSATEKGVNFNDITNDTISETQGGIGQYLNELVNPTYGSEVFNARQSLLDQKNNLLARVLNAKAMERNARGSATQAILNNVAASRYKDFADAMNAEDTRTRQALSTLGELEQNYFGRANTFAQNILNRQLNNSERQSLVNAANTSQYNTWKDNTLSSAAGLTGTLGGALANYYGNKNSDPYTFVNNSGGTSTVVPGGYSTIDLNTMQLVD